MAEEDYVSYDRYRADLADFRADMARFREEVRQSLSEMNLKLAQMDARFAQTEGRFAQTEARLMRWLPVAAGIGGLLGGLVGAAAKVFG